jgi:predicted AAA+ superfamily ATPase
MQFVLYTFNMYSYINRILENEIKKNLSQIPVIAILGPRQCGKSTLAKHITAGLGKTIYLDLERPSDLNKLHNPELFFKENQDSLVVLDEIHRMRELFPLLRSEVDRRSANGQFILLGSASYDMLRQSSESLAGRIRLLELTPFHISEIDHGFNTLKKLWLRGGFPRSYLMPDDQSSADWRTDFIQLFLERDIPQLGFNIPSGILSRLWHMCAHSHGQVLNSSRLGESLGLSHTTIRNYLEILSNTFMIRLLKPYSENIKKRVVKSPKIYIRDSGILHSLLTIGNLNSLMGHPHFGVSWEGFVIENIINFLPRWNAFFYRTSNGTEIDLIVSNGFKKIAVECKVSSAPQPAKGFWNALQDTGVSEAWIIAPVEESYKIHDNVTVSSLTGFLSYIEQL